MAEIFNMPGIKIFGGSDQERVEAFMTEVKRLCERFDCVLIPEIRHVGVETQANVIALAKPRAVIPSSN